MFDFLARQCAGKKHIIWFHAASLGEFEQGKPLMQLYRQQHPECTILVTFFSPSGYEVKKNDKVADIICYLPLDTPRNARRFLDIVPVEKAVFVKYEYWYNYMHQLNTRHVPFYYISAIFRPSQYFFKPYGKWFAQQFKNCTYFFVQNEASRDLLHSIGIDQVEITGDTRFDRVYDISRQQYELDFVQDFRQEDTRLIVAGSTWGPDEQLLKQLLEKLPANYKLVLAPHVTDAKHIGQIKELFQEFSTVCYTEKDGKDLSSYRVLVIDTIGILSKIYKYSYISYIGGAFETGLHNILEAAVFGVPLFFGPKYQKFNEAVQLVALQGAFSITSHEEMLQKCQLYASSPEAYTKVCQICKEFVQSNLGSCKKIISQLAN
ncbi:MAG: 3-deoxy-D-manno-octulosonic acid transferase [Bacteroidales bacterium]|nr:3-deoxy-D-manno-octulosonic acid transferase [Bacteroidales bacterium]